MKVNEIYHVGANEIYRGVCTLANIYEPQWNWLAKKKNPGIHHTGKKWIYVTDMLFLPRDQHGSLFLITYDPIGSWDHGPAKQNLHVRIGLPDAAYMHQLIKKCLLVNKQCEFWHDNGILVKVFL